MTKHEIDALQWTCLCVKNICANKCFASPLTTAALTKSADAAGTD